MADVSGYYVGKWVPENAQSKPRSRPAIAFLIAALILIAMGAAGAFLTPFDTREAERAVVFIEAESAEGKVTGSGAIISRDGNIITNKHVAFPFGKKADKITVTLYSGTPQKIRFESVQVKAQDGTGVSPEENSPDSLQHDWAVLKINSERPLPFLRIGDSAQTRLHDPIRISGFPAGDLTKTSSNGPEPNMPPGEVTRLDKSNQGGVVRFTHSAPLFGGYSGGPLLNMRGELIGINTAGLGVKDAKGDAQTVPGENYAIPAHMLKDTVWLLYADKGAGGS